MRINSVTVNLDATSSLAAKTVTLNSLSYQVYPGRTLTMTISPVFNNGTFTTTMENSTSFSFTPGDLIFESADMGGEGRILMDANYALNQVYYTYQYYLKDHLGSTRMVIGNNQALTEAVMYQPYGTMSDPLSMSTPEIKERKKFTGKEYDQEGLVAGVTDGLKLNYFGARFYDPEIGVWTSTDPKGQYFNSYAYSENPVIMVDKDGNFFWLIPIIVGYVRYGITNHDWGAQAVKSGLWTGAAFTAATSAPLLTAGLLAANQGIANVAQNKAQGFGANVGQFFMGAGEGLLDYGNIATLGFANQPLSQASGWLRGYAYNSGLGITGDAAALNISESQKMNETFGNYLGQGSLVKAGSDYTWASQGGNPKVSTIHWDERYKYARAKRYYAEGGYSNTNSQYLDYINEQHIEPIRVEMMDWSYKQDKWIPQFGHALGGTIFSHQVMYDAFENYGEPYEAHNIQDYSDDWGLWQWWKDYQ
jgi:RHS repeat-associated protein